MATIPKRNNSKKQKQSDLLSKKIDKKYKGEWRGGAPSTCTPSHVFLNYKNKKIIYIGKLINHQQLKFDNRKNNFHCNIIFGQNIGQKTCPKVIIKFSMTKISCTTNIILNTGCSIINIFLSQRHCIEYETH